MFSKLTDTHHLKHKARNQLGLFLKGIGLTVEESIAVWRGNFTKVRAWQRGGRCVCECCIAARAPLRPCLPCCRVRRRTRR